MNPSNASGLAGDFATTKKCPVGRALLRSNRSCQWGSLSSEVMPASRAATAGMSPCCAGCMVNCPPEAGEPPTPRVVAPAAGRTRLRGFFAARFMHKPCRCAARRSGLAGINSVFQYHATDGAGMTQTRAAPGPRRCPAPRPAVPRLIFLLQLIPAFHEIRMLDDTVLWADQPALRLLFGTHALPALQRGAHGAWSSWGRDMSPASCASPPVTRTTPFVPPIDLRSLFSRPAIDRWMPFRMLDVEIPREPRLIQSVSASTAQIDETTSGLSAWQDRVPISSCA